MGKYIYYDNYFYVDNEGILRIVEENDEKDKENKEEGTITAYKVANHAPMLTRIIRKEDGFTVSEQIEFRARRNNRWETPVSVDKKTMISTQPHIGFSPGCRIYPKKGNVSRYSEFMQIQCENAEVETVYNHTGWKVDEEGNRVFLNSGYSINKDGLTKDYAVELDPDFKCFQFYPVNVDSGTCINTIMDGLKKTMPDWVYVPLMAYIFMSPLNELLRSMGKEPCFSLYLIGKTGSYKSSISKLLLCFFGKLSYADTAPVTFLDTQNSIGRKLAVGADLPLLLDDRRPTNNNSDRMRYESIEKYVSAAIGDRATRGRLNADSTAKVSYLAKSNLIVTAEEAFVNIGSSSIARSISVEIQPDTICFEELQELQDHPEYFNKTMQLYLRWIINHYEDIKGYCDRLLKQYREKFSAAGHARLATAFSQLLFGYSQMLLFMREYGIISSDDIESMIQRAESIFLEMCNRQSEKVENEKPTILFADLIKEMLETRKATIVDLRNLQEGEEPGFIGSKCIGYRDDDYVYLIPQVAYTQVVSFYSESGYTFPSSKNMLWKMLLDEGKVAPEIQKDGSRRTDRRKRINGATRRYIWLNSSVLEEGDEDE